MIRSLLVLAVAVVVVVGILVSFDFVSLSPQAEQSLEGARNSVGQALEGAGEALQDGTAIDR
ncbi:hypothetical protein [Salinarimonas ramus]|uniref:Uncharacterized protein n=1 Tax=Salinarimonas ramus TaxID=690164 RepID=A0A917Q425_9HYPH|nr:hypothetical protein [Salinarimonas ramus]GGK18699.1 hypothetical protein GCM10011322_01760 [Salinarimonas ramus]